MSIDFVAARQLAVDFLQRLSLEPNSIPYVLLESKFQEDVDGWYFPYQSTSFVLTGDFGDSLVGNWPIFVSRQGGYVGQRRPGVPIPIENWDKQKPL